ncbi:MAG: hypothetical protein EBU90_11620 [Proteobacteria bacterium]|nr:hypothetical protein [Pseudomonadota bacterium]NBP14774.1 hypothetical protein [bacterium]
MGFHNIINESLKTTKLVRIRIKTDPSKVQDNVDFKNIEGYEGYILKENKGTLKILVLNPEMSIADVTPEMIDYIANDNAGSGEIDVLNQFKENAKVFLKQTKNKKEQDPAFCNIDNSSTFEDVESFLLQNGLSEKELNSLYRQFIENE